MERKKRDLSDAREILIVGAGVFGLSTARTLLQRPSYDNAHITIIDSAEQLPNNSSASSDTSRMLRADYASHIYTKLVSQAQELWRDVTPEGWGGQGRYHNASLVFTAQPGSEAHVDGLVEEALYNVKELAARGAYGFKTSQVRELNDKDALIRETGLPGSSGDFGYVNDNCGWVDADACMQFVYKHLKEADQQRLDIRPGAKVHRVLYDKCHVSGRDICRGVELEDGKQMLADLVILAAGAWTPSLVDLRGQAVATGQVLSYLPLSEAEQEKLYSCPIYFNASRGMFMFPPRNRELKLGRHGFGYQNPSHVSLASGQHETTHALVSVPRINAPIPFEAERVCREFLAELFPAWSSRRFSKAKICWYCDTPSGDFLIDYHPRYDRLFLATGDSGHGFKVFPVIGDKIVDAISGELDSEYQQLWQWKENACLDFNGSADGTRGGRRNMILEDEEAKGGHLRSRL